jgi:multidrug efflux pump subunit AcrA (membrane-fusion protein)
MHGPASAQLWRAIAVALAAGWVVMACGGGGDEVEGAPLRASTAPQPAPMRVATATSPCLSPARTTASVSARPDTAALEREFSELMRAEMAVGVATGAGSVEITDPFERD